jgi:protein-disulfide isomerase
VTIGHRNAPVTIEHFTDFECPHCASVHGYLVTLARQYPARVRLRHRDYPLDSSCNRMVKQVFHRSACRAALFARCASLQGRFWEFAAQVFGSQRALSKADLLGHGRQLGLDVEALVACLDLPTSRRALQEDIQEAIRRKVTGTPTTFLLLDGKLVERVVGVRSREWWEHRVGRLIDRVNSSVKDSRTPRQPRAAPAQPP